MPTVRSRIALTITASTIASNPSVNGFVFSRSLASLPFSLSFTLRATVLNRIWSLTNKQAFQVFQRRSSAIKVAWIGVRAVPLKASLRAATLLYQANAVAKARRKLRRVLICPLGPSRLLRIDEKEAAKWTRNKIPLIKYKAAFNSRAW